MIDGLIPFFNNFISQPETALVLILLAIAVLALYKQWVVPKPYYDTVEKRADRAEKALEESTEALKELTLEIRQRGRGS